MTELAEEAQRAKRKKRIRQATGLFTGCLLLLTFYSNTFQQMTIPKVSVEKPLIGQLSYELEGDGIILPKRTVSLFDQSGWRVNKINVQEGELVSKGQPLIDFDASPAQKSLADEQDRYAKQQLELEKLQNALKANGHSGDASVIEEIKRQLTSLKLDMSIHARKIDSIRKEIAEKSTLTAPFDGIIQDIQADEGLSSSPGKAVIQITDQSQGWELAVNLKSDEAGRLTIGETIDVQIKLTKPRYVKGTVDAIENTDSGGNQGQGSNAAMKQVIVNITDPELEGGEQAVFHLTKRSGMPRPLVPITAIKTDSQGEYIFTLLEEKRPLGNEFHVQKKYVYIEDTDGMNASLQGMLAPDEKIVIESSEPISDGDQVRLN